MAWQFPLWTMQQAQAVGFTVWDLFYDKWAYNNPPLNPTVNADQFPSTLNEASLTSCYGLVIGARSTVDRIFLEQTLPTPVTNALGVVPLWQNDFRPIINNYSCNVLSPILEPVAGPLTIFPAYVLNGPAAVSPTQYYPDGAARTDLPIEGVAPSFRHVELPGLHLQLLLRNRDVGLIPVIREPMFRQIVGLLESDQTNTFLAGFPVASRSKATIQFRVPVGTASFRVTGLSAPQKTSNSVGQDPNVLIETNLGTISGITGTAPARMRVHLNFEYLFIYVTTVAGQAAGTDFTVNLKIEDPCCGNETELYGGV